MSSDGAGNGAGPDVNPRNRRSSISQVALSQLFNRGSSTTGGTSSTNDPQMRRLSVTTIGLSGSASNQPPSFGVRRSSMSTNSDSIDESAVEDDEGSIGARTNPNTPFARRMSFGGSAIRPAYRPNGSPGNGTANPSSPPPQSSNGRRASNQANYSTALSAAGRRSSVIAPASSFTQASITKQTSASSDNPMSRPEQHGFNWSEQLRSRAESSVSGARPSMSAMSSSPPRGSNPHDRAKSISELPQPPARNPQPKLEAQKPDAFQERILKGDFYMD